jgi:hypothetical protein
MRLKHLLTIISCFAVLSVSAQTDYPFPWNPDADSDGFITVEDLMALLVLFGTEFEAGILESDSTSAIFHNGEKDYWDCASSCASLQGNWKLLDHKVLGSYREGVESSVAPHPKRNLDAQKTPAEARVDG